MSDESVDKRHGNLIWLAHIKTGRAYDSLYWDKESRSFYEMVFPHPERHGGGPTKLIPITRQDALDRYNTEWADPREQQLKLIATKLEEAMPLFNGQKSYEILQQHLSALRSGITEQENEALRMLLALFLPILAEGRSIDDFAKINAVVTRAERLSLLGSTVP